MLITANPPLGNALAGSAAGSHRIFLSFILAYVFFLAIASGFNSLLFKLLSLVVPFVMFLVLLLHSATIFPKGDYRTGYALAIGLYYYGFIASSMFNYETLSLPVFFKLLLAPAFVIFGSKIESAAGGAGMSSRGVKLSLLLMIVLPLAVLGWQLATGVNVYARGADFAIFANRNNAALYTVVLLSLYAVYMGAPLRHPAVYLLAGASFATLGVLFAVIVSLVILVTNKRNFIRSIIGMLFAGAIAVSLAQYEIGVFARFKPVIGTLDLLFFSSVDFRSVTYGQLVGMLNTTDLSLAFRIKHWLNIYDIFVQGPYFHWFFGYGIGASEIKTLDHIVPHNDYLRYLFEGGLVTFLGFVGILVAMVRHLGRRWETVPLLAIALYMISENLIDNFLAMAIFYYTAGVLTYRVANRRPDNTSVAHV